MQPSTARVAAYKNFFHSSGIAECHWAQERESSTFKIWLSCVLGEYDAVLLSMPPFRGWALFFLPFTRVILDIRDGWSIAMSSGYGGNLSPKRHKARIARFIEKYAIRRAFLAITCTKGLQNYLQELSADEVLFIPNGLGDKELEIISRIKNEIKKTTPSDVLTFCCSGQFSEYGKDKAEKLLKTISERYGAAKLKVKLIGSNFSQNSWAIDYFSSLTAGNGVIEILPKMDKSEMYAAMAKCDYGLSIIRDPDYEYGTKIYEYIALGLPVVNYFDARNNFTDYFDACLDRPFNPNATTPEIRRSTLIANALKDIEF